MVVNHEGDNVILLPQQTKISKRTSKKLFLLFVICIVVGLLLSIPTTTPAQQSVTKRSGTEMDNLRRDLDDLRNDFDKVRRTLGKQFLSRSGVHDYQGLITKEELLEDMLFMKPDYLGGAGSEGKWSKRYPASFKNMTSKDYRAWRSDFEEYYRSRQKEREIGTEGYEEQKIAKDRLEAELQRVLKVELKAENKAKLKAYSEAEVDAKAQKKHYSETGEFISKGE